MKPRLIFVNRFYWPYESATAQLLTDLAEHLAEQGFAAKIITGNRGYIHGDNTYVSNETHMGVKIQHTRSS